MAQKYVFGALDRSGDYQLWVTDNQSAPTQLKIENGAGYYGPNPGSITALNNGRVVFTVNTVNEGRELWSTDGTQKGTFLVNDILPGGTGSTIENLTSLGNGRAIFSAIDGVRGKELWVTDGKTASLLKDINAGADNFAIYQNFTALGNGTAVFVAEDSRGETVLWTTDGTPGNTRALGAVAGARNFTAIGRGKALFSAQLPNGQGEELFVTDGTLQGTRLLEDLNSGGRGSLPHFFTPLKSDGTVLFVATDENGPAFWLTKGEPGTTSLGTYLPFNPDVVGNSLTSITALGNGTAVFAAYGSDGLELWATDGTATGTKQIADIFDGANGSAPQYITSFGDGRAVFSARSGTSDRELWFTNGTTDGTYKLKEINSSFESSPMNFRLLEDKKHIIFSADDGSSHGREVWITDGTRNGTTKLVADVNPGANDSNPYGFTPILAGPTLPPPSTPTPGAPALAAASDTGVSSTDRITNDTTPTLTGAAAAGSTITLYDGAVKVGTAIVGSTGAYSVTSSALSSGVHSFSVTATSASGVSDPSTAIAVTIDAVAPAAPSKPVVSAAYDTGASSTDGITKSTTLVLNGTAEAGAAVTLFDGTTQLATTTAASNGAYSFTRTGVTSGGHSFTTSATDKAGNVSARSVATAVTIDTTAPVAPSKPLLSAASDTGASNSDGITKSTTLSFSGTAEVGSTVALFDGATQLATTTAASNGAYSFTRTGVTAGAHSFSASATDKAGNVSAKSAATAVTVDASAAAAPSKPLLAATYDTGASNSDGITKSTTLVLSGTAEAGSTVALFDGATQLATVVAATNGAYSFTRTGVTQGAHSFTTGATDKAGNFSAKSAATAVTVDTVAPAAPGKPALVTAYDTGVSNTDGITRSRTLAFTGTVEGGATVTLFDGSTQVGSAVTAANGAYRFTLNNVIDGTHNYTASATDKAGNVGTRSAATAITVDTKVPVAKITNTGGATANPNQTITGTGEAGSSLALRNNGVTVGTTTVAANGTWSRAVTLSAGNNQFSAVDTDKAGNVGVSGAVSYNYTPASARQAASLNSMVQAMSTMAAQPSSALTPPASPAHAETHLAAAHA